VPKQHWSGDLKVVHAAVALHPPVGVVEQMRQEALAAADLRLDWTVWLCDEGELPLAARRLPHAIRGTLLRLLFFSRLVRLRQSGAQILLRHSHGDPFEYIASFLLGAYWTVHHTLEEPELEASDHRLAPLLLHLERLLGRRSVSRARGILCVTSEIARHQQDRMLEQRARSTLLYPNGVLYGDGDPALADSRGSSIDVVFVASEFFAWHGLDRLLESLKASAADVTLHLVGAVPESLRPAIGQDRRIIAHGVLSAEAIAVLASRCWIGLSSFALDRKGMIEACTLKVREYLRAGLPVYAGHHDAALPPAFPFFRHGPADIAEIVEFARQNRGTTRSAVSAEARPYIDKKLLLARLHEALVAESEAVRCNQTSA
jgi:hypothetical protein